jgi:hypothetical protein
MWERMSHGQMLFGKRRRYRRPGIQGLGFLLLVALPLVSVHSQSTVIGLERLERVTSINGLVQDGIVRSVVNKHAVLKVQVTINSTSMDTVGPNELETKWSVVLDEVDASDSNSMVHVVQPIHLEWSSSPPHQGVVELSFVVPASVSRSFLLSLLEGQRLVTRRLANVHATKKLEDRGGSPVVSVYLEGTTRTRSSEPGKTNHSISSHGKLAGFLLFALWIFRSLFVAPTAQFLHPDPTPCDQDMDMGYDDDDDDGSAFIMHSADLSSDHDDMTDDAGYDGSVSSGPSRRIGFSHHADHSNDDDSMMPPTVFRFKVDPSRFDHLTLPPLVGPKLDVYHEQHLTDAPRHQEMMQSSFEETRQVQMVENNERRNLPSTVQEHHSRPQPGNDQTNHCASFKLLPFTEPIRKSHVTSCTSHEMLPAQELTQEDTSLDKEHQSSLSMTPITAESSDCEMSVWKRPLMNPVASGRTTEDIASEFAKVGESVRDSLATGKAPIDSVGTLLPDTTSLEVFQGLHFETKIFAASPAVSPDRVTPQTWRDPEPVECNGTIDSCDNGSHSSQPPDPCDEADDREVSYEPSAVIDDDGVDSSDVHAELSYDENENGMMSRCVGIETLQTLPTTVGTPSLKPLHIPFESYRIVKASSPTLPYLITSSAQPRNGKRTTRSETISKHSLSEEQPSSELSVPPKNAAQENFDADGCWLQRLVRPREATKITTRSSQRLLRLENEAITLSVIATGQPSLVMASGPASQVAAFNILTPEPWQRVDVANAGVTSAPNWFQRLRSRSQSASTHCGEAFAPNTTERNGDDFSYVSTLAPDSDAGSNPDVFEVDDGCAATLSGKVPRQCKPRSAKRKREYGGIIARNKSPIGKAHTDVFAELTTSLDPSNDSNEVVQWVPTPKERSSLPRARKKRRALASISNATPDAIPSAMVIAKEVNAPVWEFREIA